MATATRQGNEGRNSALDRTMLEESGRALR
jgi:hypothetical protein